VQTLAAAPVTTARLELTPLQVEDADAMAVVLADEKLHEFIGGHPATAEELRGRYSRMVAGSGRPDELWRNWVVRVGAEPVGYVQATLTGTADGWAADIAWVIGSPWQGNGYAGEAARGLVAWLRSRGVAVVAANIVPGHRASERVAATAGLTPTDAMVDGERVWRLDTLG
jgi:RimJ/RimL family protein N-acetyltransferase